MSPRLEVLLVPALLFLASPSQAQETFASGAEPDAPAPAPAPVDDRASPPVTPPPSLAPNPIALRFDGAYATRRLFSLGVTGTDLGFGLGVQTSHRLAWWWTTRVSLGSTEGGLDVWSGRMGAEVEAVYDPIRFGAGASLLMMGVDRAARDQTLHSYGIEGRAFARFDGWRTDDVAFFLRAGIDAGLEVKSGSAFWGPGIGAGLELGIRGKKRAEWAQAAPPIPML